MGVASHLGINLTEYDSRIRTFIPHYEEMLDVAAAAVPSRTRTIVDLGIGTGALSSRCLTAAPKARAIGIDVDPEILGLAKPAARRPRHVHHRFLSARDAAECDALVASFALHHVRTRARQGARCTGGIRAALRPGGVFLSVDSHPASDAGVRRAQLDDMAGALAAAYSAARARAIFAAWSHEDVYVPLDAELALLRAAGFRVELLWRRGAFAVLRAAPSFQTKIAGWTPALGNWYNPEGEGYRPPWAGLSLLDLLEQFRKRIVRSCDWRSRSASLIAFTQIDRIVAFIFAPMRKRAAARARG